MGEDSTKVLANVIRIDDERIQDHLGKIVRGSVEATLNALLEAEADRLCGAERYERTEAPLHVCIDGASSKLVNFIAVCLGSRHAKTLSNP